MELLVILIVGVIGCCSSCLALEGRTASLARSNWVKLIAGASNNDIPLIRNLCYVYASVGVDCIDCSADPAVVLAAQEAIDAGTRDYCHFHLANYRQRRPLFPRGSVRRLFQSGHLGLYRFL